MLRKDWLLGFLGLFSIKGFMGLINQDWTEALWAVWAVWFLYFVPSKNKKSR
jgi:hypothetical protein